MSVGVVSGTAGFLHVFVTSREAGILCVTIVLAWT